MINSAVKHTANISDGSPPNIAGWRLLCSCGSRLSFDVVFLAPSITLWSKLQPLLLNLCIAWLRPTCERIESHGTCSNAYQQKSKFVAITEQKNRKYQLSIFSSKLVSQLPFHFHL